jgi:uncharacterized protein (TIGR00730 family)
MPEESPLTPGDAPLTPDEELLAVPTAELPAAKPHDALRHARIAADDAFRVGRIADELAAGFDALADVERAVSVFGSARTPPRDPDYELARAIAARLGGDGVAIITGGGPGIMEAANLGAREAGALSIGLTIDLPDVEHVNPYLDVPVHFHYFFARKVMFVRYASAFVVFPGGLGTLDELFELVTLIQTHKIRSPPVVLANRSYWEPLLAWLRETVLTGGKISPSDLDLLVLADDADEVMDRLGPAL